MSSLPPCSNSKKIPQNIIKKNGIEKGKGFKEKGWSTMKKKCTATEKKSSPQKEPAPFRHNRPGREMRKAM